MTSLAEHQSSESTKLLLMGNSGSGKTGAPTFFDSLIEKIPLTQEKLHSFIDYDFITGLTYWIVPNRAKKKSNIAGSISTQGYWTIRIDYELYFTHDLIWLYVYGRFPLLGHEIDHEDRVRANNSFDNLRELTRSHNMMNSLPRSNTGFKGVTYLSDPKRKRRYMAQITLNQKHKSLGCFFTAEEASQARKDYMKSQGVPDDFIS